MLLMDDFYDPDDILMDPDAMNEFDTIDVVDEEIDFENPSFSKSTLNELAGETESISEFFN
ncbi:MAG TPA: hypothetical protein VHO70_13490 [Chitinispirillaceae bacterium]|nr:hypothetical protein [Chitinispirillaceae bacterium]